MATSPRTRVDLYFSSRFRREPQGIVFVPGRIVLLGEHVDHQGGPVLAVPHHLGIYVGWGVRPDRRVVVHALNVKAADAFDEGHIVPSGRRWADLARGVFATLAEDGRRLPGLDLVVYGDLPPRAGLASSAAYTSAILRAVFSATGEEMAAGLAAQLVARVEQQWAGVACGFMDPYVALVGRPGEVIRLDNRTLEHTVLSLPDGTRLEHAPTGIERRLDETPYNARRQELAGALAEIRRLDPAVTSLVGLTPRQIDDVFDRLTEPARKRARHVVTEVERVRRGEEALANEDAQALGVLMRESHASLSHDFECSLPEIDGQVAALASEDDVLGVRLQGAGWGGSLAVLRRAAAEDETA